MKNNNYPTTQECCKMLDIIGEYLSLNPKKDWDWDETIKFIQSHWNDVVFNIDYKQYIKQNNEYKRNRFNFKGIKEQNHSNPSPSKESKCSTSYGQVMHCIPYEGNEHLAGTNGVPVKEPKPKERWRAEIKGKYYFVDSKGKVGCNWECRSVTDDNFYDFGNYFQTIEEAVDMIVKMKKLLKGEWT